MPSYYTSISLISSFFTHFHHEGARNIFMAHPTSSTETAKKSGTMEE